MDEIRAPSKVKLGVWILITPLVMGCTTVLDSLEVIIPKMVCVILVCSFHCDKRSGVNVSDQYYFT